MPEFSWKTDRFNVMRAKREGKPYFDTILLHVCLIVAYRCSWRSPVADGTRLQSSYRWCSWVRLQCSPAHSHKSAGCRGGTSPGWLGSCSPGLRAARRVASHNLQTHRNVKRIRMSWLPLGFASWMGREWDIKLLLGLQVGLKITYEKKLPAAKAASWTMFQK